MNSLAHLITAIKQAGLRIVLGGSDISASNPLPVQGTPTRTHVTLTIANGASVSDVLDLERTVFLGFFAPAAWTTAGLQIQASADGSTNWGPITDSYNSTMGSWSALTATYPYVVDPANFLGFRYIRFLSGTVASPVNQGAARSFTVLTRPLA